jgi:hypothetical protein
MTIERTGGVPMVEPGPQPGLGAATGAGASSDGELPPGLRLQILATEHWSLLATRSLAWNESFTRAGMLLSALAGAVVALALVGQGSGFGSTFVAFGIVILPVVLLLGVTTYLRLGESNGLDAMTVIGMNRIRHAYLEMAPDLAPYFVTGTHDDLAGLRITQGLRPGGSPAAHLVAATPVVVMMVNAVVAGAIAGLVVVQAGAAGLGALVASMLVFVAAIAAQAEHGRRMVARVQQSIVSRFPGQPANPTW